MTSGRRSLRFATRASQLALVQTELASAALTAAGAAIETETIEVSTEVGAASLSARSKRHC